MLDGNHGRKPTSNQIYTTMLKLPFLTVEGERSHLAVQSEENQIAVFPPFPLALYLTTLFTVQPDRKGQERIEKHYHINQTSE